MLVEKIQLEPNEKVLAQTRRHWFVLLSQLLAAKMFALVPLIAILFYNYFVLPSVGSTISLSAYWPELLFGYLFLISFLWIILFGIWTNYYLDVLTITDRRVVLVDQRGFFWRHASSFRLERMQDVKTEVNGFIATLLDFGTLELETASDTKDEFKASGIPNPSNLKSLILQAVDNRITTTPNHPDSAL